MLRNRETEQKGLGQVSRIVLPLSLCALLCMELYAVLQQFALWQKVFRSPVLSKCLTFDKCCIVLAKQQYKHVTIWCLSSMHTLFLCDAFVKLEWNQGTLGTHLKDRHRIQPALFRVRFILDVRFSLPMEEWICLVPYLFLLVVLEKKSIFPGPSLFQETLGWVEIPLCCFLFCPDETRSWIVWVMLLTEIQLW